MGYDRTGSETAEETVWILFVASSQGGRSIRHIIPREAETALCRRASPTRTIDGSIHGRSKVTEGTDLQQLVETVRNVCLNCVDAAWRDGVLEAKPSRD